MASGTIDVTPGSGEEIAFDKGVTLPGSVIGDIQFVKNALGADATFVGEQSGRLVDGSTSAAAGFVEQRSDVDEFVSSLTVSTTAYSVGDAIGSVQTITAAAKANGGGVRVDTVVALDDGQATVVPALDIVFFRDTPSAVTNDAAFTPSTADLAKLRGAVSIATTDWVAFASSAAATKTPALVIPELVSDDLHFVVVARNAADFVAASDLTIVVGFTRL